MKRITALAHRFPISVPKIVFVFCTYLVLASAIYTFYPVRQHWSTIFRPAALAVISGRSPYDLNFYNPPWALLPVIPFALLPERLGNALYSAFSLFALGFVALRMGAKPIAFALFMLLPMTLYNSVQVNVDCLTVLGFILPPQIGLFFILIKPQIGAPLLFFWIIEAWRHDKLRGLIYLLTPILLAFLISFFIYGFYFLRSSELILHGGQYTYHFWPYSLPIGLALLVEAIRRRKAGFAIASSPLLSPYTQFYTRPLAIMGLLYDQPLAITVLIGFYLIWLFEKWPTLADFIR